MLRQTVSMRQIHFLPYYICLERSKYNLGEGGGEALFKPNI